MLGTLVIFLREGLEASLIVSILLSMLRRLGCAERAREVYLGVAAGLALALSGGALAFWLIRQYDGSRLQTAFETATFLLATAVITYMTFWMQRESGRLTGKLGEQVARAGTSRWSLGLIAFQAVGREGLETVVFTLAIALQTPSPWLILGAALGLGAGLEAAHLAGRLGRRLPLKSFFLTMGTLLLLSAAGLLANAASDLQALGVLPTGHPLWDSSRLLARDNLFGNLLHGIFGYDPRPQPLQVALYLGYLAATLSLLWWKGSQKRRVARAA